VPATDGRHRDSALRGHLAPVRVRPEPHRARREFATAGVLAVASMVIAAAGMALVLGAPGPALVPGSAVAVVAPPVVARNADPVRAVGIVIPDLGIDQTLTAVGVDGTGELVPPPDPAVAGWFAGSAAPGDAGPSVIVGHVDSRAGPGVFFDLGRLEVGAEIRVRRSDGRTVAFQVAEVYVVPKDEFPTERVYGPVPVPELRLITCGGEFDRSERRYLRNVVVTAVPLGP
jgi:hypothetical protein